ncbi:MAG: patatin-like protein [Pyrinomonadaceae bacterium]
MSQSPPTVTVEKTRPAVEYTQEVRFAVVMYGGSSLAIYMNGVAQELLRLVRATAPERAPVPGGVPRFAHLSNEELEGSTRVYRKLGQILARGEPLLSLDKVEEGKNAPLQTRFIIDILTGTSAGGINAVYLAKALANDQSMDELKKLWVREGDIGVLLNDGKSDEHLGLGGQKPPRALLNGRRMYLKLLQALRGMDNPEPDGRKKGAAVAPNEEREKESPLVDELDLFVTTTDMNGRVIPLRLADGVAHERRHRNVFRFRYYTKTVGGEYRNDFSSPYNPFLAFAARSTSAHQAAFEVMRFNDIKPAVKNFPPDGGAVEYPVGSDHLKKFYEEYLPRAGGDDGAATADGAGRQVVFEERSFSDGGVLDNSPFSFASDALPFRHADAPVDRKLIYIEPSPEHPEDEDEFAQRPDFFKNALMALTTLPRYQTIVEDLVRVLGRNRLIERVGHILNGLEDDLKWRREHDPNYKYPPSLRELLDDPVRLRKWAEGKRSDISWGGYQRLRVAEVTDDLTLLVARAAGFDEDSDEFTAVRYLVRQWRTDNYAVEPQHGEKYEAEFLLRFDLMWLVRRVKFVLQKINQLSCFDERAREVHEAAQGGGTQELWQEASRREAREALSEIKRRVARAFTGLRVARNRLWSRAADNIFRTFVAALGVSSADLLELLKEPTDKARRDYAKELLRRPLGAEALTQLRAAVDKLDAGEEKKRLEQLLAAPGSAPASEDAVKALTEKVWQELQRAINRARARCKKALDPSQPRATVKHGRAAPSRFDGVLRYTLWYYYRHFDDYDLISYPILHATEVGDELDPVEVFRISPEDAVALVDEKKQKVQKLAGTTLGHFGAFFEKRFRQNDIMWGRLDAAERVICALLPNQAHAKLRDELIEEAHRAIIVEESVERLLEPKDKAELRRLVAEELKAGVKDDGTTLAAKLVAKLEGANINPSLKGFLHSFLEKEDPLDKFKRDFQENYDAERAFTPRDTVLNAGRASRIFGRMVDGIAAERRRGGRFVLWLVRLTRWVWGLAEVAVPGSLSNLFTLHLLRVLYFFEAALIALGIILAWKEVQRFGLIALAITGGLHALILFVGDFILGGPVGGGRLRRWVKFLLRLGLVIAIVGVLAYLLFITNNSWLPWLLGAASDQLKCWQDGLLGKPCAP